MCQIHFRQHQHIYFPVRHPIPMPIKSLFSKHMALHSMNLINFVHVQITQIPIHGNKKFFHKNSILNQFFKFMSLTASIIEKLILLNGFPSNKSAQDSRI